jgi:pimeloyl-ACP methyl ester carboxylesterase
MPMGDGESRRAVTARRVDAGGYRLAFTDAGVGSPAVVLEAGGGCGSASWGEVPIGVARFTRVVSYDRAGLGGSEPAPARRTYRDLVADLRTLLAAVGVPPPCVLVGHSLGGLIARLYAHEHPRDVAGLVLVDAVHPDQDRRAAALLPPPSPGDSPRLVSMRRLLTGGYEADRRWNPEGLDVAGSGAQLRTIGPLGDRPLVVLTARDHGPPPPDLPADFLAAYDSMFHELQCDLAGQSSRSMHLVADRSGHFIQRDEPGLVVEAIRQVVDALRGGNWPWTEGAGSC